MKYLLLAFSLIALYTQPAQAEYRVFLLQITKSLPPAPPVVRTAVSNLDPDQYREYYHLEAGESVVYTATWICRGRTDGFTPYCPNPRAPASAEGLDPQAP